MAQSATKSSHKKWQTYRNIPTTGRRVAANEPGILRQQLLAVRMYLEAQANERRIGIAAKRLFQVCHSLACDRSISYAGES